MTDPNVDAIRDEAKALLFQQVYLPTFFQKLAQQYGIVPKTEEEQISLLKTAEALRAEYERRGGKAAYGVSEPIRKLEKAAEALTSQDEPETEAEGLAKIAAALVETPLGEAALYSL